jgi:hypothetical protein
MAQTRGTFPELHDNLDRTVFTLLGKEWKERKKIWSNVYDVKTSKKRSELVMTVTGVGDIPEKPEGQPFTTDVLQKGYDREFLHTEFGNMFEVTLTAQEDDRSDVLADHAKWFMFAARVVQEKRAHILFNNGFTTETSPDGAAIFSGSHSLKGGGTARNRPATDADLSWNSLQQAIIDWNTDQKFEAGQFIMPTEDLLLFVPPHLMLTADRIVNSKQLPGVADNDRNSINALFNIKVLSSPYLTDTDAWFLLTANKSEAGFVSYTRVPMTMLDPMTNSRTRNREYPIRWRSSWGNRWWQGSYGTIGA